MALVEIYTPKGWITLTKVGIGFDGRTHGKDRAALESVAAAVEIHPDELKAALIAETETVLGTVAALKREIEAM